MKRKDITYGALALVAIIGWNVFLTQRDAKLFGVVQAQACEQLKTWHPDCR